MTSSIFNFKKIFNALFSLIIILCIMEAMMRYFQNFGLNHPGKIDRIENSKFIEVYEGLPWEKIEFSIPITRNSINERSGELTKEKDQFLIGVIGDSFVEALQVHEKDRFTTLTDLKNVQVFPFFVGNQPLVKRLKTYRKKYSALTSQPDALILSFRDNSLQLEELTPQKIDIKNTISNSLRINEFFNVQNLMQKAIKIDLASINFLFYKFLSWTLFQNNSKNSSSDNFEELFTKLFNLLNQERTLNKKEIALLWLTDKSIFKNRIEILNKIKIFYSNCKKYDYLCLTSAGDDQNIQMFFARDGHPNEFGHLYYRGYLKSLATQLNIKKGSQHESL